MLEGVQEVELFKRGILVDESSSSLLGEILGDWAMGNFCGGRLDGTPDGELFELFLGVLLDEGRSSLLGEILSDWVVGNN